KSLKRRHPWVYSGAVARVQGKPGPGEAVEIHSAAGAFLAIAAYSPHSQIVARVWEWQECAIDGAFFRARVASAVAHRRGLLEPDTNALRLIHGESDGLPRVIADRYDQGVVVQLPPAPPQRSPPAISHAPLQPT